jgi:hypothetical protein
MEYLQRSAFLPAPLVRFVNAAQPEGDQACVIRVPRGVAEEFRSAFSDQLAKVGFGPDYEPTSEGRVLEELIDLFFLGDST